jgi:hypothetical protein
MANWEVTKTTKHGKPIEEYTTKIKKDHWKIESKPHFGAGVGSLYRWDDLRGLRLISTGNIDQLKRQAEGISGKNDAVSDLLRGFSRPGAKDMMAEQAEFRPGQSVTVVQGNKIVKGVIVKKINEFEGGEYMVELPDPLARGRMMPQRVAAWKIRASRPGAKDMMAVEEGQVDVDGVKYRVLPYQLEYFKTDLAKFDDPKWRKQVVQQYLAKNYIKRFSRPGAKDMMAVEDRFYFGKGRKERFAGKSASGESDLRDLLRQYWLAKGDESEKTKVDRGFLKAVMNRPAYRSPDPYVAAGQSTHELANKIWRLIDPRFGRQYLI